MSVDFAYPLNLGQTRGLATTQHSQHGALRSYLAQPQF